MEEENVDSHRLPNSVELKSSQEKLSKVEECCRQLDFLAQKKVKTSDEILCVQNGGLGNDVCQEELLSLFISYGDVENIVMLPQKPFCFVYFTEESTSVHVFENLNGHILKKGKDPSQDVILYFLFVEKAPDHVIPASYDKPNGLHVVENFIDEETENQLLSLMNQQDILESRSSLKHRRVKHYGYEFCYDTNDVDVTLPLPGGLPACCQPVIEKVLDLGLIVHHPDQLTINQYQPGQGIPSHVDTEDAFEDGIMSLSLGSQVVMEFRHPDVRHARVILPQRSLMVMTGESRYIWSHGITPRKSDILPIPAGKGITLQPRGIRTSFTFRKVIFDRKQTGPPESSGWSLPQTENEARELEKEHVHKVYEDIADHFSGTRYKPWPRVVEFLKEQPAHSLMADVGCGNGKCLGINETMFEVGCDYSTNLLSICRSRGFQTCVADVCGLPFRSNAFDVVLCIAVIHHMATKARRQKALTEVVRILRSGGKALVYVWAMEQQLNKTKSKYIKSNRQKQMDEEGVIDITTSGECEFCDNVTETSDVVCDNCSHSDLRQESNSEMTECGQLSSSDSEASNMVSKSEQPEFKTNDVDNSNTRSSGNPLKVHVNRTEFQEQDMLVPWQLKGKEKPDVVAADDNSNSVFHRFYHVFKQGELEELSRTVDQCVIRQSYYDQGNWCVVLEKL